MEVGRKTEMKIDRQNDMQTQRERYIGVDRQNDMQIQRERDIKARQTERDGSEVEVRLRMVHPTNCDPSHRYSLSLSISRSHTHTHTQYTHTG